MTTNDSKSAIYRDFVETNLSILGAVYRLMGIGYGREDAQDLVNEWADELDAQSQ